MGFLMSKPIVIQPAVHDKPNKRAECDKAKTASPQSNNSLAKDIPADDSSKEELAKENPDDATNVRKEELPNDDTVANSCPQLLPELWSKIFSSLPTKDLFSLRYAVIF